MSLSFVSFLTLAGIVSVATASVDYPADTGSPGDAMIQSYLAAEANRLTGCFLEGVRSADDWQRQRARLKEEYFYMLGLWPRPEKTPLAVSPVSTVSGDGFVVEVLHFQSRPHLYVTCNLYRPSKVTAGEKLPAVLQVCGHWGQGRDGVKVGFQPHGMWYARHGYVCLVVDTLQLGEIAGIHHGTYREQRWWWHSRGYTSAGVECWNGIRAIDYLVSRPDVDPGRIGVTGCSGGGAASFWIAAADERVTAAVPVSGMADLPCYVNDCVVNGHCDCMFLYNTFEWPWTYIAALVAPRPLLFVNSDRDPIFPMDANERIIGRLERLYGLLGVADRVDAVVSIGGHAYRKDIRQSIYRFFNTWLKNDPRPVEDSEVVVIEPDGDRKTYPIDPVKLRAFPTDSDIPRDQLNTTIDQTFVPTARVEAPKSGAFEQWKKDLMGELRRVTFRHFRERVEPARVVDADHDGNGRLSSEPGVEFFLRGGKLPEASSARILLVVTSPDGPAEPSAELKKVIQPGDWVMYCDPRGVGRTRWTRKNPPNYVERAHALLGRTVDVGRVWDVAAAARYLSAGAEGKVPVYVAGEGAGGVLGAYAALLEADIAGAILVKPPSSHMKNDAPQLLNVLRVCDIPDALGMLAPKPLTIVGAKDSLVVKVKAIYAAAGAAERLLVK